MKIISCLRGTLSAVLFGLLLGFLSTGTASAADSTADTPEAREHAAREYLKVQPISEFLDQMADQMSGTMGPKAKEQFLQLIAEFDKKALEDAVYKSVVKHFTVGEIHALTNFYASAEGKSVMKKMAPYLSDVMPVIQAQMAIAAKKLQEKDPTFGQPAGAAPAPQPKAAVSQSKAPAAHGAH